MERILAIEDSRVVQAQLQDILQERYRLVISGDGPEGIAAALDEPPDLILLDIYLPGMDGYAVCRALKGGARTREVPIVFITSLDSDEEKVRGGEPTTTSSSPSMPGNCWRGSGSTSPRGGSGGWRWRWSV